MRAKAVFCVILAQVPNQVLLMWAAKGCEFDDSYRAWALEGVNGVAF